MLIYDHAVDLDGTITAEDDYPNLGKPNKKAVQALRQARARGETICVYTCRLWRKIPTHQRQEQRAKIKHWLIENRIPFDALVGKMPANNYIDNRNLSISGLWAGKRHAPIVWIEAADADRKFEEVQDDQG
ncbi:MAG TPA: hypothetical protein PLI71_09740 [Clostridia bacterium]|nr:hypothetical protein [Clostridia bacterium]